jgi:ABC-2 type transport system permease protein
VAHREHITPEGIPVPAFLALVRAGFGRYATYRRATYASAFTNTVFGFLNCYLFLAVLGSRATVVGYDAAGLATFVWVGQGLLGVVQLFTWTDVADRIRTGDIVSDLLRPIDPLWAYLAADLGRAGHALLIRLTVPVAVGALVFQLRWPTAAVSWALILVSVALGVVVSFAMRYACNLLAFWWLDARGPNTVWLLGAALFSGISVPVPFYPTWLQPAVWLTPFPWMYQAPLDVLLERGGRAHQVGLVIGQLGMAVAGLALAYTVQRVALRRLEVQGG